MPVTDLFALPLSQLIYSLFIPFIIIFSLLWGMLGAVGVFNKKINLILALAMTLLIASTDYFVLFSTYLAQYSALTAMAAFGILFIVGVAVWAFGRGKEIYTESDYYRAREKIIKKMAKIDEKIERARTEHEAMALAREKSVLEDKLKVLEARAR